MNILVLKSNIGQEFEISQVWSFSTDKSVVWKQGRVFRSSKKRKKILIVIKS